MNEKIEKILCKYDYQKNNLLNILREIQSLYENQSLDENTIEEIATKLRTTKGQVYGVTSYYSMLNLQKKAKYIVRVCQSPVCFTTKSSCNLRKHISKYLGINVGEITKDGLFALETVECLGHCDVAPAMLINDVIYGNLTPEKAIEIIENLKSGGTNELQHNFYYEPVSGENRLVLKHLGKISPLSLDEYLNVGGFEAFKRALNLTGEEIIEEVIASGLRGRGGAGFPTGLKWKFTHQNNNYPKYVVCNADEGEPGTFKDRPILEMLPFQYIEGIMIAAKAIGANKAYIYIRGEYKKSIEAAFKAIEILKSRGFLGNNILGTNFSLDIEIFIGQGSYLCGDELTLLESIEGKRGHPRIKPPFPAEKGLFDKPTIVNNVETFATIPLILTNEKGWLKKYGTAQSAGTKIFSISGDVPEPRFVEFNLGTPLSEILKSAGCDIANTKAVLVGGAAGTFVDVAKLNDIQMAYETLQSEGYTLGSGAIMVFNKNRSIYDILYSILKFFAHESCGKCVPCRVGTTLLIDLLQKLLEKDTNRKEILVQLIEHSEYMVKNSLCALGQSPALAIKSCLRLYEDELLKVTYADVKTSKKRRK